MDNKKPLNIQGFLSADDGTRTRDLLITNEVRYHLCHISILRFCTCHAQALDILSWGAEFVNHKNEKNNFFICSTVRPLNHMVK